MSDDPVLDNLRVGAAYVYARPLINSDGLVDLTIAADEKGIIPSGVPRPVYSPPAIFLGFTQGITQSFALSFQERVSQGALSFTSVTVAKEDFQVSGSLVFNNDLRVLRMLLPPGGSSRVSITGGGQTAVPTLPLLVIPTNRLVDNDIVLVYLYYRGYFQSINIQSSRDFHAIDFVYKVGSGLDSNGCLLQPGARDYKIFFYNKITGELDDPNAPVGGVAPDAISSDQPQTLLLHI